jgi:predicted CoA-binding protein
MTTHPATAADKRRILETVKTIAVVGLSSIKTRPGYTVPEYLQEEGYRIIPVNPHLEEALGETAFEDLHAIPEPVDMVLIFRRSEHIPAVVEQAIDIGAKVVWMQLGLVDEEAAAKAQEAGLEVVMDSCSAVDHRRLLKRN